MKKVEEEPLFVGIRSPVEVRRNLLEASKGIVESLQKHERFKSTREKKLVLVHKLREDIKEISKLIYRLRMNLPKLKLKPVKKEKPIIQPVFKKKKVEVKPTKHKTELDKLEAELVDIEKKLDSIS